MSTPAPGLESFCFPGYHLGFRKHSFMVVGLLPAGPMVINQGQKWCRPQSLQQTLCAAAAGGLDSCFQGFEEFFFVVFYLLCFDFHGDLHFVTRWQNLCNKNQNK